MKNTAYDQNPPHQPHQPAAPSQPQAVAAQGAHPQAIGDVAIVALLKSVWTQHHDDPDVVEALKHALKDGMVNREEAKRIEASAAYAVARKTKNAKAFAKVEEDPKLLAEAIYLKKILDPNCLAAMALDDMLKDGKVTREEMKAFAKAYLAPEDKQKLILAADADKMREQKPAQSKTGKSKTQSVFAPPKPSFADIPKK